MLKGITRALRNWNSKRLTLKMVTFVTTTLPAREDKRATRVDINSHRDISAAQRESALQNIKLQLIAWKQR